MRWIVVLRGDEDYMGTFIADTCVEAFTLAMDKWDPDRELLETAEIIVYLADELYES